MKPSDAAQATSDGAFMEPSGRNRWQIGIGMYAIGGDATFDWFDYEEARG
jgi:hypothetical protein